MSSTPPVIVRFRQDLRRTDNPALSACADAGYPVLPVYILDDGNAGDWQMGAASRWWLHRSLASLNQSLGGHLRYFRGDAAVILMRLAEDLDAAGVYWNRCFEPWRIDRDRRIKAELKKNGCSVQSFNGSLLFEPQGVAKADGSPYKVFTPYYRKGCLGNAPSPRVPLEAPELMIFDGSPSGLELDELKLMPSIRWYDSIAAAWTPGETGALERLERFLDEGIRNYKEGRNRPDLENVSRLSPHLHFGEVSPHQVWHAANALKAVGELENDIDHFLSELGWREFSNYLLYHWPALPQDNLQEKFDRFPWRDDPKSLRLWQRGQTGYPIVDAGMRELWQTGYMHNRVRMIVGSFLVKNLLLHWHRGEAWFWDTLVDADLANNSAGWQWIAGCGADAAPYFRIFNPVAQGQKFDPAGDYVRRFVPELARLPDKFLHSPWQAPAAVLAEAGIALGSDYPNPMVDLWASRERALEAFRSIRTRAVAS
jgi:deoxyribodipyrimidine photo-lyase